MPRQSSILRKGLALIAIPVIFQVLFAGFLLVRQRNMDEAERWAIHTKEVISEGETMFRAAIEADSAVRAFVTTGDASFDAGLPEKFAEIPKLVDKLLRLVSDNPPQVERMRAVRREIEQFIAERLDLRRAALQPDRAAALDKLPALIRLGRVKQIRAKLDEFLAVEQKLDTSRVKAVRTIQGQQVWILATSAVALIAIGLASASIFSRSIVRRLDTLNANVHRLTAGESLVAPVGGDDEISTLDASFHQMANDLAEAAEVQKHYRESLEKRGVELTIINRELSQKSDENEMFVYSVSHDLRSPLVNLLGFSKELGLAMNELKSVFVEGNVPAETRAQAQEILDHGMAEPIHFIQTAVTRLSAIIDALLRLSRAGRVEYQRTQVDVHATVVRVVDAIQSTMTEKGAKITIAPGFPEVWADPTAVEQIFANLISNALNYLDPKRPGVVDVSPAPEQPSEGLVTFCVRDNGLGIPEAYLAKIFAIFQRVHGNIAKGEGIGLALVRRMVERHGGRIWVESVDGEGSAFFVSLPGEKPAEEPEAAEG